MGWSAKETQLISFAAVCILSLKRMDIRTCVLFALLIASVAIAAGCAVQHA